jgi:hypothetical protein
LLDVAKLERLLFLNHLSVPEGYHDKNPATFQIISYLI